MNSHDKGAITSSGNTLKLSTGKKFVFWIAGYSRGAAVSNLMAKRLVELCHDTNSQVIAYTFETPRAGWQNKLKYSVEEYDCIHNVVDLGDVVPRFVPQAMKFIRYRLDSALTNLTKLT